MIAAARSAVSPLLSGRPLGFDPRWVVRHAAPCDRPAFILPAPRYIGGSTPPASIAVPCQAAPGRLGFAPRDYRSLRRRLDRWELEHLREHAADLAERLEAAERALANAEDAADHWREQVMRVEMRDGECLGLALDGSLQVIAAEAARQQGGAA